MRRHHGLDRSYKGPYQLGSTTRPSGVVCASLTAFHGVTPDKSSYRPLKDYVSRPVEALAYAATLVIGFAFVVKAAKNL